MVFRFSQGQKGRIPPSQQLPVIQILSDQSLLNEEFAL